MTLVGSLSAAISESPSLHLSSSDIGFAASSYLIGAVAGSLVFGELTDHFGRRRLFFVTVLVYLVATVLTGVSWDFWSFAFFRFMTGAGIGGEYAAVNSAIQELIPARYRGHTDLAINGSFWVGAALGALGSIVVLDRSFMSPEYGWRFAFIIGGLLAGVVVFLRQFLPESPRWLMTHGRQEEAARVVAEIEEDVGHRCGLRFEAAGIPCIRLRRERRAGLIRIIRTLFVQYRNRAILGVTLMAAQAFCYNAIFFTYALILTRFYDVPSSDIGWFMLPFALGNFTGPLILGRLFDTLGRRFMITATYAISGVLLIAIGVAFQKGMLSATGQTAAWSIIFFFASAAASSAYLTVSESFPLEARALAIAIFYAFGTAVGGVAGPAIFGALIETGSRSQILLGYAFGGAFMLLAALAELILGVKAERRALEEVALPMAACD